VPGASADESPLAFLDEEPEKRAVAVSDPDLGDFLQSLNTNVSGRRTMPAPPAAAVLFNSVEPPAHRAATSTSRTEPMRITIAEPEPEPLEVDPVLDARWYYSINGQRAGPVGERELARLLVAGTINNDSLVWRTGLDSWIPISHTTFRRAAAQPPPLSRKNTNIASALICGFVCMIVALVLRSLGVSFWDRIFVCAVIGVVWGLVAKELNKAKGIGNARHPL